GKPVIQTTDENGYIYIAIPNSPYREHTAQLLNGTYWIQLEKGEIATSYEYFIPNSPSPNYPNEIKSVSNFDLITSSKNLFNDDLMLNTNNYEYISPYHYYEISGLKPNTNYTLGLKNEFDLNSITKPSVGNRAIRINNTKINPGMNVVNVTSAGAVSTPRTIKSNTDGTLYLVVYQPQILDSLVNGLQLEEGDSQTTYEPFKGKKVNFPYTLRSLPDGTKDYIEIDNIKKTAKLYRNVGEKIFDGTENWIKFLTDNKYYVSNDLIGALYQNETYCLSTHYLGKTSGGGNSYSSGDIWLQSTSQYPRIYIADDNYSTVNSFKGFLAEQYNIGTPVKAQYQLEKSIIEHLDYNEIKTFYSYTQIYTNSTVQPNLEAKMRIAN
ncbi:MAG: hypothetical protein PHD20_03170, partial [Clostridia bacterium]|nr:hypothetical protein [Clostridia bacterium]